MDTSWSPHRDRSCSAEDRSRDLCRGGPRGGGRGGRHEGHGTVNRIVPLGGGYLEVLGVADAAEAASSAFGRGLLDRLERQGDGWLAWVVAVPDVDPVARRLGTTITTLRREGLSARLTGVEEAMREPLLPFFVSRDPGEGPPALRAVGIGDRSLRDQDRAGGSTAEPDCACAVHGRNAKRSEAKPRSGDSDPR